MAKKKKIGFDLSAVTSVFKRKKKKKAEDETVVDTAAAPKRGKKKAPATPAPTFTRVESGKTVKYFDRYKQEEEEDEIGSYGSDSYYPEYGRFSTRRTSYHRDYSTWSWGNWGYQTLMEDSDESLYIKAHPSYLTPTNSQVSMKMTDYRNNTAKNRDMIREFARYFYYQMIEDKNYFKEKYDDLTTLSEREVETFFKKKEQYENLWEKHIPGYTPLEKAIFLFNTLIQEAAKKSKMVDDLTPEQIKETCSNITINKEIYEDPIINELLEMQSLSKDNKMDILQKIALVQEIGGSFKVEKEIEEKIVNHSRIHSKKIMRDFSQIYNVDLYQRLMPTYNVKLLMKDLVINAPIDRTEHKQKIIILLDYSGSMDDKEKQKWVLAVMIDRLKYVIKEEAEIFFSYFVSDPNHLRFHHLHNRKTVFDFWQGFSTRPNGGQTHIGSMIDRLAEHIPQKKLCNLDIDLSKEKPEALIINDGQDSIKTTKFSYKTNAITIVDRENQDLKRLCVENNGKYVYASSSGIKVYDKSNTRA